MLKTAFFTSILVIIDFFSSYGRVPRCLYVCIMNIRGCFQCVPCLNPASTFNLNTDQTESYISGYNVREIIEMVAFSQESNILTGHCVIIITVCIYQGVCRTCKKLDKYGNLSVLRVTLVLEIML